MCLLPMDVKQKSKRFICGDLANRITFVEIDDSPLLLETSYRLRYRSYCLERHYLPASEYPEYREIDEYDAQSIHVGMFDREKRMIGTFRLVLPGSLDLPLLRTCSISERGTGDPNRTGPEVSRFILSTHCRRDGREASKTATKHLPYGYAPLMLRAVYQLCRKLNYKIFYLATDKYFERLLTRYRVYHQPIGPEVDYFGRVRPFVIDLDLQDAFVGPDRIGWWRRGMDQKYPIHNPHQEATQKLGLAGSLMMSV